MTAHVYWDQVWRTGARRAEWSEPDRWVADGVEGLRERGVTAAVDLGCGIGRHTVFLAEAGFSAFGLDKSTSAVSVARDRASGRGVTVELAVGDVTALPYVAASFDFVLAFNVLYHADEDGLGQALGEVRRVLRPGGMFQATYLSKRNWQYGRGIETSRNTFCQPEATDDKVHPHVYSNGEDIVRLHRGFELLSASDREQSTAGSFHWHCRFEVGSPAEARTPDGRNGSR